MLALGKALASHCLSKFMQFHIITLFPELIQTYAQTSILGRALKAGHIQVNTVNPRDFVESNYKKVDDTPYGGGPGMVMMIEPLIKAYDSLNIQNTDSTAVWVTSPSGKNFNQAMAVEAQQAQKQIVIFCGHYEGIDHRIYQAIPQAQPLCVGEAVLTGGELPALFMIDAITRLIPGVLGDSASLDEESFSTEGLLEYPHYTRPQNYNGLCVPEVLLSGNHQAIAQWRKDQQLAITQANRPETLK